MKISGAGCCLLDYLYTGYSFSSDAFKKRQSLKSGDGGLIPGQLVFSEQLGQFAGLSAGAVLSEITGGQRPDSVNIGGPGVIAMIHASQVLDPLRWECSFHGVANNTPGFLELFSFLEQVPLKYVPIKTEGNVPSTTVLSDPDYHNGAGERTFINTLGAADRINPDQIKDDFFDADLFLWGGTALVPPLHDQLTDLIKISRVKNAGSVHIVGTVYDFRSENKDPEGPWPLGARDEPVYPYIDLLITDEEEAYRLSGTQSLDEAIDFFRNSGTQAFIITRGRDDLFLYAEEQSIFRNCPGIYLPVSPYVNDDLRMHPEKRGDTTGCGDNFMGGVLASIALQRESVKTGQLDPVAAAVEGICAGGLALYSYGGCMIEKYPGEKSEKITLIRDHYLSETLPKLDLTLRGKY